MVQYGIYRWNLQTIREGGKTAEINIPEVLFNAAKQLKNDLEEYDNYYFLVRSMTDKQFASYLMSRGLITIIDEIRKGKTDD